MKRARTLAVCGQSSKIVILSIVLLASGGLWGWAHAQSPQTGTVVGTVVRSRTSEPLGGVIITLTPQAAPDQTTAFHNASAGRGPHPKESLYLAHDGITVLLQEDRKFPGSPLGDPIVTDASGRFVIENVPIGSYAVSAKREGYFGRGMDPETPSILDGAAMSDMVYVTISKEQPAVAVMTLIPASAISGRVMDTDGKPLANQDVRALRIHRYGNSTTLRGVTVTSTDDRGNYRLHTLPPGEYFIGAGLGLPERSETAQPVLPAAPTAKAEKPVFTFHPSATDPSAVPATMLEGGEDLDNKDIRVQGSPILGIAGEIVNLSDARNLSPPSVAMLRRGWGIDLGGVLAGEYTLGSAVAAPAGTDRWRFEIRGAFPPGAYELLVVAEPANDRRPQGWIQSRGSASVNVGSQDINGVVVVIGVSREAPRQD